ncbi:MAG TPA: DUF2807 domain-containing protein [Myxococcaceae bacterium]|nr:DUF2807 domain-containing protein [Myxococcaceae bacterium]
MKTPARAVVMLLALCVGCDIPGLTPEKGNGQLTTDARTVAAFTNVLNTSGLEVSISEGTAALDVIIDGNLQEKVITSVANGTLVVGTSGAVNAHPDARVRVVLPELADVGLQGSGTVQVSGLSKTKDHKLANTGSGALRFSGPASILTVLHTGGGLTQLSGTGNGLAANLSGSGNLDARSFVVTGAAKLVHSGSGTLTATVNGTVSFELSGAGNIDWYGTAHVNDDSKDTGTGQINHR